MGHTPGPWKINGVTLPGRYQIDDAANKPVAITDARYDLHTGYEQADANARLIAAAPELLSALKAARASINSMGRDLEVAAPDSVNATSYADDLRRIDALLAKAETT